MPITMQRWPEQALDIAAELRKQLDESYGKRAELDRAVMLRDERIAELELAHTSLNARIDELCAVLQREAEAVAETPEREAQGSRWWYSAWTNGNRRNAQLQLRIAKLERWQLEAGTEATKLQSDLEAERAANAELTRRIAESERDYTEMYADREELRGELDRCECGRGERVH